MNSLVRVIFILIIFFSNSFVSISQESEFTPSGNVYGRVFSDFEVGLAGDDLNSAFEVTQAYFGYKYKMSSNFSANIKLDIGSPDDSEYSKLKRYAYFKVAELKYKKGPLTLRFGIIGMKQFKLQEKFWTRKFVKKTFQDYYKFGPSADIGAAVTYEFLPNLIVDALVMNGEGYKQLQADDTYKNGFGITYFPIKGLKLKVYSDYSKKVVWQNSFAGFVGYNMKGQFSLGAEYNYQTNHDFELDNHFYGTSVYGSVVLHKKWEIFARYDMLDSYQHEGQNQAWNESRDGQHFIGGIQFNPIKKVKLAIDLQHWIPSDDNINPTMILFFHTSFDL